MKTITDNLPLIMMLSFLFGLPIIAPILNVFIKPVIKAYSQWMRTIVIYCYKITNQYDDLELEED